MHKLDNKLLTCYILNISKINATLVVSSSGVKRNDPVLKRSVADKAAAAENHDNADHSERSSLIGAETISTAKKPSQYNLTNAFGSAYKPSDLQRGYGRAFKLSSQGGTGGPLKF